MKDETKLAIETALVEIRGMFIEAATAIEDLKQGDRIQATGLAERIGKSLDLTGPETYPTLKFLLKHYPDIELKRGAKGGIYKK